MKATQHTHMAEMDFDCDSMLHTSLGLIPHLHPPSVETHGCQRSGPYFEPAGSPIWGRYATPCSKYLLLCGLSQELTSRNQALHVCLSPLKNNNQICPAFSFRFPLKPTREHKTRFLSKWNIPPPYPEKRGHWV